MIKFEINKLNPNELALAKELILMFGFDDESKDPTLPTDKYVSQMLERADFHVIVALENNQLIGGLTAYEMKMFKRQTTEIFLYEIGVDEAHQQKGVATALIEYLKEICSSKGIVEMFVGTEKANIPAQKLYATTGGIADEESVWFNYLF